MTESADGVAAVVVAAGSGRRFGPDGPRKQYRELRGHPLLAWALAPFLDHPMIVETIVVLPVEDVESPPPWLARLPIRRIAGGAERGDSVRAGLEALPSVRRVLVHDGARPLVTGELIDRILAEDAGVGVVPALPVTDTLKEVDANGLVIGTAPRDRLWRVQTPQAFPRRLLLDFHRRAAAEGIVLTDDAGLFELYSHPVKIIPGEPANLKVTSPFDLSLAELLAAGLPKPE